MKKMAVLVRKPALIIIVISIGIHTVSCIDKTVDDHQGNATITSHAIEEVVKKHTEELMSVPGVVGVGQGLCDNKPCIKVYIIEKSPELEKKIPSSFDGYKVSTEVTGEIRAHPNK